MSPLPGLFLALSGATLVLALAAIFRSLRAAFGDDADASDAALGDVGERGALLEEKKALLRALKDLEYEHEVGKIDDADYRRLNESYRARARHVLGRLDDDLGAHREAAEKLLEEHVRDALAPAETKAKKKKKAKKAEGSVEKAKKKSAETRDEAQEAEEPELAKEAEVGAEDADTRDDDAPPNDVRRCPSCDTPNDLDATFCKRCATRLAAEGAASDSADDAESPRSRAEEDA